MTGEEEKEEEKDGENRDSTDFHVLLGRKSLANHDQLAKKGLSVQAHAGFSYVWKPRHVHAIPT